MDYSKITDRLLIGQWIHNRPDMDKLQKLGVTHILNSCAEHQYLHLVKNYDFQYLWNPEMDDFKHPKPVSWFKNAIEFYKTSKVLYCHCIEGRRRSPSLAYAILRTEGMEPEEAEQLIKEARPIAELEYKEDAELALNILGYKGEQNGEK